MLIRPETTIRSSEITDEQVYLRRREFVRMAGSAVLAAAASPLLAAACEASPSGAAQTPLADVKPKVVSTDEKLNSFEDITSYNNFYEFGTGKNDPQRYAGRLKTTPWTVKVDGLCAKPADYAVEDLIKPHQLEERIYRLGGARRGWWGFPGWGFRLPGSFSAAGRRGKRASVGLRRRPR